MAVAVVKSETGFLPDQTEVAVGRVARLFGQNGELEVTLFDTFPEDFNINEEAVFVRMDEIPTPLFFCKFARRGTKKANVAFDDFDTDYRANMLIGKTLFMYIGEEVSSDKDDDELFMEDVVGFELRSVDSDHRGVITDFMDDEFNPLFSVMIDGKECMIPANDDLIEEISVGGRFVLMNVPEGLFDLDE